LHGYFGKYLHVDMSTGTLKDYPILDSWYKRHIGGRGIAARIMLDLLPPGADPLGPDNVLVFASGPLQGHKIAGGGRHVVVAKSPKTNAPNEAYVGGFFVHEVTTSGYDGLIIVGQAEKPMYLTLLDGKPELHDANEIWGKETSDTEDALIEKHGKCHISSIGPAGENGVIFACIISDRNRAAGRPGFGAVMGSKNLKAIAVRGHTEREVFDKELLQKARVEYAGGLARSKDMQAFGKYGTPGGVPYLNQMGILPTKNFQKGTFDKYENITGELLYDDYMIKRDTCTACPVSCKRVVETEYKGQKVDPKYGGPEYETIGAFGSICLIDDLAAISLANQKCNAYGLDTISTGVVIAAAIEATEKGLLESNLIWGDADIMLDMVDQIATRTGLGDELAKGIKHMADRFGEEVAVHIKGQEVPMHDPRGKVGFGLSYAITPRGGTHMEGMHDSMLERDEITPEYGVSEPISRFSWDKKPEMAVLYENMRSFTNSCVLCMFTTQMVGPGYNFSTIRKLVHATTGMEISPEELLEIGARNFDLLKILAAREGYTRSDDGLHPRLMEPLPEGSSANRPIEADTLNEMIDKVYDIRGWDHFGPTDDKLQSTDLEDLVGVIQR